MSVHVETLEKLGRRITLSLPTSAIETEVSNRLKRLARTVKAAGFRPGKVPMSVVTQRYGDSVQYEVLNDKVGEAFGQATAEAKLRVAGAPRITQKDAAAQGQFEFDATFEVYPEVKIGSFDGVEIQRVSSSVNEAAIDRTVDILRKQRRTFQQRPAGEGAAAGDRVTIDFDGTIDGEPFAGGKAEAFQFIIGEGQMLEAFDAAVRGMKSGESKTFPLPFPADYHGKEVAGKEADFLVTLKKIEAQHLPTVDEGFVKGLGIADGSTDALRVDVKKNLERELKFRVQSRNKGAVMDALIKVSELDLPTALVEGEVDRMIESARADLKQRGVPDSDKAPIPRDIFQAQAEKRVRLGLVVAELVRANGLQAKPDQLQKHIEEISQSYEKPAEVMRWYLGDRQRMAEVEALVIENNVADFVLGKAKVSDSEMSFDELMGAPSN
jgi:trigger factor